MRLFLGVGLISFGAKYFETLYFCHRIISDPNQSSSDISSGVLLKIILSLYHCTAIKLKIGCCQIFISSHHTLETPIQSYT